MKYKNLLVIVIFVLSSSAIYSQMSRYFDERYIYTQGHIHHQLLNVGAFGSANEHQLLVNFRQKWAGIDGAPRTLSLSYNGPVGNGLGVGVNVLNDRFGELETTKGVVGLSYTISTDNNRIGFGISAEYLRHGLSTFGVSNPIDPVIAQALQGTEYFDASFGLFGLYMDRLTYGLAIPSAISARITDQVSTASDRQIGFILHAGYKVDVQTDITMTPSFIVKRLANVPTHIDLNMNFGFMQDKLIAGATYTVGADKRVGFLIGTKLEKMNFYYSYNTSNHLIQDYNNGSHELTLGVTFGKVKNQQ